MDIVGRNWVWKSFEMASLKHVIGVKIRSLAMFFWEICAFEEVKECISEATHVIVLKVYYGLLFLLYNLGEDATRVPREARTSLFSE